MILVEIIILYLVIINIYYYHKFRLKPLNFNHWGEFINSSVIVLSFFVFFFIFVRILSLFREKKVFDLTLIFQNYDVVFIICCIGFLIFLRRTLMFVVKLNFIKLHYFFLNNNLPMNPIAKQYKKIYFYWFQSFLKFLYSPMSWVNILFSLFMFGLLCYDCLKNNLVLDLSLWFAPFYSLFKFCFIFIRYVAIKQNPMMDFYLCNLYYVGTGFVPIDRGFFGDNVQSKYFEMDLYEYTVIKV